MERLSPGALSEMHEERKNSVGTNQGKLVELMAVGGYSVIPSMDDLQLTAEQKQNLRYIHGGQGVSYFHGGENNLVKVVTQNYSSRYFAANVFNGSSPEVYACNNDFTWVELEHILKGLS